MLVVNCLRAIFACFYLFKVGVMERKPETFPSGNGTTCDWGTMAAFTGGSRALSASCRLGGGDDDNRDKTHPHHSQYPWQALGAFPTWNIPENTIICIAFVELGHVQLFLPSPFILFSVFGASRSPRRQYPIGVSLQL